MSAIVVERTTEVAALLEPITNAIHRANLGAEWFAVAVASAAHRHPHFKAARRLLDAMRDRRGGEEAAMAEFASLRPDVLRAKAVSFSSLPNKDEAARRFVGYALDDACRITDACRRCLGTPVSCSCPRAECTRCGARFRESDARSHECVDNKGNRWVGGVPFQ